MLSQPATRWIILASLGVTALAGCKATETPDYNEKPAFVGAMTTLVFDGIADDLLTAGLGENGLKSATPPAVVDPANPTVGELRRLAIYNNYRAQVDTTTAGGFGVLFGPNVDANGSVGTTGGLVSGTEYLAYADDGTGRQNIAMLVQVPSFFNRAAPCVVTATSAGSRGVYGSIATAGEWALKRGCAVVYVDKGTGNGVHDIAGGTANAINGPRGAIGTLGTASHFTATGTTAEFATYNSAFPNRMATKHAHSQVNPERDWGLATLQGVEFAIYVLNEQFSQVINGRHLRSLKPENTLVIASSTGEGGAAALAALEQDTKNLIDGVAVAAPAVQMVANGAISVRRGAVTLTGTGRSRLDYATLANLLQPCAAIAPSLAGSPGVALVDATRAANRCQSLKAKGVLAATTTAAQSEEALAALIAAGWQPESNVLHAAQYALATPGVAVTYANSYGRFSVRDNLCGYSFASVGADGKPIAAAGLATIFGTGLGAPPMAGIEILNNNSTGGAIADAVSLSPTTTLADFNIDGALCLRNLAIGSDANATRVQSGINEVRRSGNLRGKPAIIVHGRADAQVPAAFSSRPYFGLNKSVDTASKLAYIEIANAHHFDALNGSENTRGYDARFVPLQRYFNQAMDMLYNNITANIALPPSQVVRTVPRGGNAGEAPALTATNVPSISATPAAADQITFSTNVVTIPE